MRLHFLLQSDCQEFGVSLSLWCLALMSWTMVKCISLAGCQRWTFSGILQEEVGHDAVQLLDRAMMAPDKPAADCMSAAAPASLYLAVCQDTQHSRDALPLLSGISTLTGLPPCQAALPA